MGGESGLTVSEEYNGTGWTEGINLNTGRKQMGQAGTQTLAICFGSNAPFTAVTEEYNGTSWATGNSMGAARYGMGSGGTGLAAVGAGGNLEPAYAATTEEYTVATATETVTVS